MELKEIKCKNCGAALEVEENAKTVTCKYCDNTFAIESDYQQSYDKVKGALDAKRDSLNEMMPERKKIMKIFTIIPLVIFTLVIAGFVFGIISMFNFGKDTKNSPSITINENKENKKETKEEKEARELKEKQQKRSSCQFRIKDPSSGYFLSYYFDEVRSCNKIDYVPIVIEYKGKTYATKEEISDLENSLNQHPKKNSLKVIAEKDADGYVTKLIIKEA